MRKDTRLVLTTLDSEAMRTITLYERTRIASGKLLTILHKLVEEGFAYFAFDNLWRCTPAGHIFLHPTEVEAKKPVSNRFDSRIKKPARRLSRQGRPSGTTRRAGRLPQYPAKD